MKCLTYLPKEFLGIDVEDKATTNMSMSKSMEKVNPLCMRLEQFWGIYSRHFLRIPRYDRYRASTIYTRRNIEIL